MTREIKYPSWLFFSIYHTVTPHLKWNEEKEKIANEILKNLTLHLKNHDIENAIITEPNEFDNIKGYYPLM